jgi:xanthine dehydrogenase accessory factor
LIAARLPLVLVVGGGEVGSAVCHRLSRSGMGVVVTDLASPRCLRRKVCFAMALLEGSKEVEGVRAAKAAGAAGAATLVKQGRPAVLSMDFRLAVSDLGPDVLVDARMTKTGEGISCDLAPLVIGLGPGFIAGDNADAVVETKRGHDLGKVIYRGSAAPDTGEPGSIMGFGGERVIWAPRTGRFRSGLDLGALVDKGGVVGFVEDTEVRAPISGLLRGLVADGIEVTKGKKMGDIDPRGSAIDPETISDRGRAIGGGVLEAVMHWWSERK